ncbi:NAD(P)H-hydrate dehydratase [Catenisphaera adipataccumulans]|uniref:Bifunctional NAD(P)H-hydrate repair enzyme n=1 Tax=Catenisphaera adipataccumulans TaxID=700500 RepID=A0A7W8FW82_9FIRM|nr:NAD(P)H-hydrate dehydratase [Catenisphaera adipataccumulans]MBB5182425.1 NAD(P)H-hydrate epimerase [Catenisphaera adipataccumulans]
MTLICTKDQARAADACAIQDHHIPSLVLMEHAAMETCRYVPAGQKIRIVCGPGNNGADGLAMTRLLLQRHEDVSAFLTSDHLSDDEQTQLDILHSFGIHVQTENFNDWLRDAQVIVDCLFGNGLSRPIEGKYKDYIEAINASDAKVISVDLPSGLEATTGNILGTAVQADVTVALDCLKAGHLVQAGPQVCGELHCADIGIPKSLHPGAKELITKELAAAALPARSIYGHKGTFGKALMIGGSRQMHGAISFAAQACYRSGIGTLTLFVPEPITDILSIKMDCAMKLSAPSQDGFFAQKAVGQLADQIHSFDPVTIGNGMGRSAVTEAMVRTVLESECPAIVDADGLWALRHQRQLLLRQADTIVTPHVKELTYLIDLDVKEIADDPIHAAEWFASLYPNCTLILKSGITVIARGSKQYVFVRPDSGLAKGGSGDVLCGILTGMYGQAKDPLTAAISAVYVHSLCAKQKKDPAGIQPEDWIYRIPEAIGTLRRA